MIIQNFDFEKAYDTVKRRTIYRIMRERNVLRENKIQFLEWLQNQVVTN